MTANRITKAESAQNMLAQGVVITDLSLKPIAFDDGAASILAGVAGSHVNGVRHLCIPEEVLHVLRSHQTSEWPAIRTNFRDERASFVCQAFIVDVPNADTVQAFSGSAASPVVVLHLQSDSHPSDPVYKVAAEYHLTDREKEALEGLAMGLTSKEVADRMKISPNTVRAFVRLIMIKMGVPSRSAIMSKLLEHHGNGTKNGPTPY